MINIVTWIACTPRNAKRLTLIVSLFCFLFGRFIFIITFAPMENNWKQGLTDRHISQIIRRKMLTKVKPSGKVYSRKNIKNKFADNK